MDLKNKLQKLATQHQYPSITISLNTHRTHPENLQDEIVLKNLIKEARERLLNEFTEREVSDILEKLSNIEGKIDINHLQDSLHIFLSKDTEEIIQSMWNVEENSVYIDDKFAIRPVILAYNRTSEYLILLLTQDETKLYKATNDLVTEEVNNHVFPFGSNPHFNPRDIEKSDAEYMDNIAREHFRDIDKALVDYIREHDENLKVVVISDIDNYHRLQHIATKPEIYIGYDDVNHLAKSPHHLSEQAWKLVEQEQKTKRSEAIEEIKEAISQAKVLTDLQEIYQASLDGRAELLMINEEFKQPVKMIDARTFSYENNAQEHDVIDDITSYIAWEVISKNGRVHFTKNESLNELGKIALKTRY